VDNPSSQNREPNNALSDDALAVARFFQVLMRGKWSILLSILITTAIAAGFAWTIEPVYSSHALLAYVDQEGDSGGLGGLGSQLSGLVSLPGVSFGQGGSSKEEVIALLSSRDLSQQFMERNQIVPDLYPGQWDQAKQDWKSNLESKPPTFGQAFKLYDQDVRRVNVDKTTGLITVSMDHTDRQKAADWANALVAHTNERMRTGAVEEANHSIAYLQNELTKTNVAELQQAIYRLIESQLQKIMLADVRQEYSFKVLDPAVVAEEGDFVRPKRLLMLVLGVLLGTFIGVFIVIVRQAFSQLRAIEN